MVLNWSTSWSSSSCCCLCSPFTTRIMLVALILGSLSTWRLTYMLMEETGPAAIFEKLRAKVDRLPWNNGGIREGFYCFMCFSVWVALLLLAIFLLSSVVFYAITFMLSLSAVAIFINDIREKNV